MHPEWIVGQSAQTESTPQHSTITHHTARYEAPTRVRDPAIWSLSTHRAAISRELTETEVAAWLAERLQILNSA